MQRVGLVAAGVVVTLAIAGVALRTQAQKQDTSTEAQVVTAQAQVVTLTVPEMDCSGCEVGIKIAASKIDGVHSVKTDLEARTAEVTFDASKTDAEAIANAITKGTGFKIELPKRVKTT
jgi:mercuric ion binding protein